MTTYLRPAAVVVALVAATYGVLLIAAGAAPAPTPSSRISQSSVVADQLKAESALLVHPGTQTENRPQPASHVFR